MEPISSSSSSSSLDEVTTDAHVSKFLDDMMPTKLFWSREHFGLWVFWSQEEASTDWAFQERIVTAIRSYNPLIAGGTLLQFWAAQMVGGRRHLTTTVQPFTLNSLTNGKLVQYRKICVGSNLVVADAVEGENMDGILGRVFRNQLPEVSPDLSYYSVTDYPLRDLALSCGFKSTVALPVLEPSQQCCVGVLELLYLTDFFEYSLCDLVSAVNSMLKKVRLETIGAYQICEQIKNEYEGHVEEELEDVLYKVCKKHKLPFADAWVRCARISCLDHDESSHTSYNDFRVSCEGELLVSISSMSFDCTRNLLDYRYTSSDIPWNVHQGLVGKAALSRKPYLCKDVRQLSITEYPLVNYARKSGLSGCFAVCLRTISTSNHEYVIELFLPIDEKYGGDINNLVSSILVTMKEHFRTFEVVTGDIGNDLFIEVDKFTFHKEFESFKEIPTVNTQLQFEVLQIDGEVLQSDSIHHQSVKEDLDVLEQPEVAISLENVPPVKQSKAQNQEKKNSCSRKDLEQHFGRKLVDAAEILGVSRSTVKRWCREHKINRWPSPKRSKLCSLSSIPKQTNVLTQDNVEPVSQDVRRDSSCSEPPTNVALMPAMSMITVKATYGQVFIKFKLSLCSSRMADLVEKVIMRTRLGDGTFSIIYLDDENDPILLACDEDLQDCMDTLRSSGKTTIRMQIEPIANRRERLQSECKLSQLPINPLECEVCEISMCL